MNQIAVITYSTQHQARTHLPPMEIPPTLSNLPLYHSIRCIYNSDGQDDAPTHVTYSAGDTIIVHPDDGISLDADGQPVLMSYWFARIKWFHIALVVVDWLYRRSDVQPFHPRLSWCMAPNELVSTNHESIIDICCIEGVVFFSLTLYARLIQRYSSPWSPPDPDTILMLPPSLSTMTHKQSWFWVIFYLLSHDAPAGQAFSDKISHLRCALLRFKQMYSKAGGVSFELTKQAEEFTLVKPRRRRVWAQSNKGVEAWPWRDTELEECPEFAIEWAVIDFPLYPSAVSIMDLAEARTHHRIVQKVLMSRTDEAWGHPAGSEGFNHLKCDWKILEQIEPQGLSS
ncbi:hypothetical protein EDD15DRAFT_2193950 [Pisolithus albus]|nr:hypothetical protein EDD15DRAFT_2193950 [Pisolithus albus]